jgi:hypothetical protein
VPDGPRVTLVGDSVHVSPVRGETVAARLTTPVNPLIAVTVTVEVPLEPPTIVTLVGLAATPKSFTA